MDKAQNLAESILGKVEILIHKANTEDHEEELLKEFLSRDYFKELPNMTVTECHVIKHIGENKSINAVTISKKMNITKGGISKIMARMTRNGLIESAHLAGNRKEIFYTLTSLGEKVFLIHEKLHEKYREKFNSITRKRGKNELECIYNFLNDLIEIL